ncbi:nickel-dependent lactate racemase [Sporomusa sp.]|uniref:nickel-dependent lactate racemase n=1 Tax=Sporomusa sp. TaxID=2078658 RepID=UPI002C1EC1DC|nr:nickel-dependent lactate racemase [Sporomusa sp.]HWR44554.1 nickel-dependent lactate racemase [Sporomusa sp.]
MEKNYAYKYGKGKVSFSIDTSLVIDELYIKDYPVLSDPAAAIREAIRNPIGSKPLQDIVKPGETVAFIVNDTTRVANSHIFMPILLDELNAIGVPDKDMRIVFALGTHRLMTEEEMAGEVGPEVAKRVKMYNSDCKDKSQFEYLGETSYGTPVFINKRVTEVDHIICTGSVVHHFFAGFGGGRKAILPGVAYYETVRKNHSLMLDSNAVIGKLEGNPIYHDQVEGTEMCRPSFLLNVVLNEKKEFLKVFAGDYIQAHLECCKLVDEIYGARIQKEADLVIASCGGFPKDINVYQLQKTMDNAWCAVREGGVVIILGECAEGSGSAMYEQTMQNYRTPEQVETAIRADFQIGAHKAYSVTRLMKKAQFILISSMAPELAQLLLFTPARDIEEALELAFTKLGSQPSITLMPMGSLTVPLIEK